VISRGRPAFWKLFHELPGHVRQQAREAHRLFLRDPGHPSLNFKKLRGVKDFWSVRIGVQYRAVGRRSGDTIDWVWIGTHNDFDRLF
jgi:hypothetical protein